MWQVKEALLSMLAGDIFGKTPIWRSLGIKAIFTSHQHSISNVHGRPCAAQANISLKPRPKVPFDSSGLYGRSKLKDIFWSSM
jgi:hypothetical protein